MDFRRWRYFYLCLIMLLGAVQLRADVTGSIIGYVRDSSGAVLPNATLTVIQTSTGYTRTATTDGSGAYSILALPPGIYRLTASMAGFREWSGREYQSQRQRRAEIRFCLKVGNVSQTVSVDASTVQVDTATTSLGTTITSAPDSGHAAQRPFLPRSAGASAGRGAREYQRQLQ